MSDIIRPTGRFVLLLAPPQYALHLTRPSYLPELLTRCASDIRDNTDTSWQIHQAHDLGEYGHCTLHSVELDESAEQELEGCVLAGLITLELRDREEAFGAGERG